MESGQDEHHGTGDAVIDNLRAIIAGLEYHEGRQRTRAEAAEKAQIEETLRADNNAFLLREAEQRLDFADRELAKYVGRLDNAEQRIAELEPLIAHHQKHHDILCTLFEMAGKRMHERDDGQCLVEYWRRVTRIWEQKVTELERLVPDQVILECAAFIMRTGYGNAENTPAKLEEYAAAIREYREEGK